MKRIVPVMTKVYNHGLRDGRRRDRSACRCRKASISPSRPGRGYSLADVATSLPKGLQPDLAVTRVFRKQEISGPLAVSGIMLQMLPETHENVSATQIRNAVGKGQRAEEVGSRSGCRVHS